jgi:molybdate transport system substrate-binding protein
MSGKEGDRARVAGISSMAMRSVLAELAQGYEKRWGQAVTIASVGGIDALRRVQAGEPFDFVALAAEAIDRLAREGHVDPASRVDVARSGVAVAVASGAPRPDIGSEEEVREAVLAARTIGYSTGPSGVHLARLFERWGIAADIAPRVVQAPPGVPVASLVARGEVALGFQQLSELMHVPGIDVIGPLPPAIQVTTIFSAAVCKTSTRPDAVERFLAFLGSTDADAVKPRHGMTPG